MCIRDRAGADPDPGEVRVAGPALPEAGATGQRPQVGGVGFVPEQGRALPGGGLPGLAALLGEVAQVVAALGPDAAAALGAGAADLDQGHADHGDAHHPGHRVHGGAAVADGEHQHHRAGAEPHRQVRQHGTEVGGGGLAEDRGLRQFDLFLGQARSLGAGRTSDDHGAHVPYSPVPLLRRAVPACSASRSAAGPGAAGPVGGSLRSLRVGA